MKYDGKAIQLSQLPEGIVELTFDLQGESVNKFNQLTVNELQEAVAKLKTEKSIRGLLIRSKKDSFIVGADVTEFLTHFKRPPEELQAWLGEVNKTFSTIEDFEFPTICAINGFAFGGGLEIALTTSFRVLAAGAKVGLLETKLGIFPGWGGTVRLSRLVGADNAIEWIASGDQYSSESALKVGVVDAVVAPDQLHALALQMLQDAIAGKLDWKSRREEKKAPLKLNKTEATMVFEGAKGFVAAKAGPHYPAPLTAIEVMQQGANKTRDEALAIEGVGFVKMAHTPTAKSLVGLFLGDQYLKKVNRGFAKNAQEIKTTAVLGAGIMGGGVAYQTASKGIPILMKDISETAIVLGLTEATKLMDKQVSRGKMTTTKMAESLTRIRPTLSYGDFASADLVVEAVVENEKIKKQVLAETETHLHAKSILSSNTSTISINSLAEGLKRPENFCGVHFFNPVHRMPLVEIIRGKKTSETTIATAVQYAQSIGKTPIVVNDCAGFLVNRILFPYFAGFVGLVKDGVEFKRIDKVMEKFGWPMGPAYLLDVVGIDTGHHADAVMAHAYPDRMGHTGKSAIDLMFEAKRYGQKNGVGFYKYVPDKKGVPKKEFDPAAIDILKPAVQNKKDSEITDQEIVERMMLPMIFESSRCLEDKIVASPVEVDLGLIYGLGFPPFRGGALAYADSVGLSDLCGLAEKYRSLGKLYEPTEQIVKLAKSGQKFYSEMGA